MDHLGRLAAQGGPAGRELPLPARYVSPWAPGLLWGNPKLQTLESNWTKPLIAGLMLTETSQALIKVVAALLPRVGRAAPGTARAFATFDRDLARRGKARLGRIEVL
jgi:hypothetical protein